MAINTITRPEFDAYQPTRSPMSELLAEEVEWFADDAGNIIGTVFRDRTDNDWAYVLLGRDERGQFRAFDLAVSIEQQKDARAQLLTKMTQVEASGQTEFPQGD